MNPLTLLDELLELATARGCELELRLEGHKVVAQVGRSAAAGPTPVRALRALADELAPRPLRLCQREETHG